MRDPNELDEQDVRGSLSVVAKDDYLRSTQAALLTLPSYRRFPRDDELRRELVIRDMYNFRRGNYWLRLGKAIWGQTG